MVSWLHRLHFRTSWYFIVPFIRESHFHVKNNKTKLKPAVNIFVIPPILQGWRKTYHTRKLCHFHCSLCIPFSPSLSPFTIPCSLYRSLYAMSVGEAQGSRKANSTCIESVPLDRKNVRLFHWSLRSQGVAVECCTILRLNRSWSL
jgi:hypothetical protein